MNELSWKRRLAILLSAIWVAYIGVWTASDTTEANPLAAFVLLGAMPVALCWGVAWVWSGFRRQRRYSRIHPWYAAA
jgi:hypothetical protein